MGSDSIQQLWEDFFSPSLSLSGIHFGTSSEEWEITKRGKEEQCGQSERKIQTPSCASILPGKQTDTDSTSIHVPM